MVDYLISCSSSICPPATTSWHIKGYGMVGGWVANKILPKVQLFLSLLGFGAGTFYWHLDSGLSINVFLWVRQRTVKKKKIHLFWDFFLSSHLHFNYQRNVSWLYNIIESDRWKIKQQKIHLIKFVKSVQCFYVKLRIVILNFLIWCLSMGNMVKWQLLLDSNPF